MFKLLCTKNVITKEGKFFLSLIDKHSPLHHKLQTLFNQNNLEISNIFLANIKSIIKAHNRKILYLSPTVCRRTCSCINMPQGPLDKKCLRNIILYGPNITPLDKSWKTKVYYGICEITLELQYTNHKTLFNLEYRKSDTEQSNEFWDFCLWF